MRKIKDEPVLPRCNSSDVKPKMIELDSNIGHKSEMSICELFIDRDEPSHLVDQEIHDMEVILDASAEGDNGMGQLSRWIFQSMGPSRIECQSICLFFIDRDMEPPCHTADR